MVGEAVSNPRLASARAHRRGSTVGTASRPCARRAAGAAAACSSC